MSCFKCDKVLSAEEVKAKLICDFCNGTHCLPCSGLSTSETRVTQLAKGRILLFACEKCITSVKTKCSKTPTNNMEDQLKQLQVQFETAMLSLKEVYTQKIDDLKENLAEKLEMFKEQLNTQKFQNTQHPSTLNNEKDRIEKNTATPVTAEDVRVAVNDALGSVYSSKLRVLTETNGESSNTRIAVLRGTGGNGREDFRGEVGKMWIYIGRVTERSNEAAVKSFIKGKINLSDGDLVVQQLQTRGKTNSFKIGIEPSYYQLLNDPGFWPANIVFRRFNFRKELNVNAHRPAHSRGLQGNGDRGAQQRPRRNERYYNDNHTSSRSENSRHYGPRQNQQGRNFPRNYHDQNRL